MRSVLTLALKDLLVLWRDRFALFWILAFPLMFALFFGFMFGGGGGGGGSAMSVVVVDEDRSAYSEALVRRLADHASVRLPRGEDGALARFDLAGARRRVRQGDAVAYLRLPAGFGDNPYAVFGGAGPDAPRLELGIDPGRQAEAGMLQGVLMETLFGTLQDRMLDTEQVLADIDRARDELAAADDVDTAQKLVLQTFLGALRLFAERVDPELLGLDAASGDDAAAGTATADAADAGAASPGGFDVPLDVVDVTRDRAGEPRSAFDITMPQAMVWGLMSVALGLAITLVRERTAGTLLRLRMAPLGRAQILAGKAVACTVACLATMGLLTLFATLALGVEIGSPLLFVLGAVCTALCFTGLMMTVSVMGKTEAAVAGSSWGLLMPFAMLGGGMMPLYFMPDWLQTASVVSPFGWAIRALEGAIFRGFGPLQMALPCGMLLAMGALFFGLGVLIFRRTAD